MKRVRLTLRISAPFLEGADLPETTIVARIAEREENHYIQFRRRICRGQLTIIFLSWWKKSELKAQLGEGQSTNSLA
jgi:hypothetical protein